jgi:pimeloyl-ACP methyl ester carboxylesterase
VAPNAKRVAAYVAAGAFSVAGVAFAITHEYTKYLRRSAVPEDPELFLPGEATHRQVSLRDGGEAHLVEMGEGPALLLLHGASLSAEVWSYQLRDLSGSHRVIAMDLRGHGGSLAGEEGLTISAMADDVAEVIAGLGLERVVLVGHSMGGMVCLRLARAHPSLFGSKIGALALVSTSAGLGLPVLSWGRLASAVSLVAGAGVGIWRPRRGLPSADTGYLASRLGFGRQPRPAEVAWTLAMLRAIEPQVFNQLVSEVLEFEESAPFFSLNVPVVVAVGTSDHLTPPLYARRMAAEFEGAELSEYRNAGHMLMYERREEIDELLTKLAETAQGSGSGASFKLTGK